MAPVKSHQPPDLKPPKYIELMHEGQLFRTPNSQILTNIL